MEAEPDSDLGRWIERYRQRQALLNHSARTWPTTRGVLAQFVRFLAESKVADATAITAELLRDYQRWLFYQPTWTGRSRSASGRNRCLRVVRGFCRFLHEEGVWLRDPALGLHYAREPHTLPRNVLTQQEAREIIETPDVNTAVGYRDRVILEVLYGTGIRKSELQNLCLVDVDLGQGLLRINGGKGAKDRVAPLTGVAGRFLESYINGVRSQLLAGRTSDRLFVSMRGRPIAKNTLDHIMEKYARLGKVGKHVTCHLWRHTCATHLIQNRANLRHVQELLGHRSLATTERYLHLTIAELKAAHSRHHPRERQAGNT